MHQSPAAKRSKKAPVPMPTPFVPAPNDGKKHRNFSLTVFNEPVGEARAFVECLHHDHPPDGDSKPITYICAGNEKGKTRGKDHYQVHITFANPQYLNSVVKLFKKYDCRVAYLYEKSTPASHIAYCKKEGNWFDSGRPPLDEKERAQVRIRGYLASLRPSCLTPRRLDDVRYLRISRRLVELGISRSGKTPGRRLPLETSMESTRSINYNSLPASLQSSNVIR